MPRAEERLSHLLSGDLNGFTSAEHPEPPAKHPMGASHVKMVFSWTRELEEQQTGGKMAEIQTRKSHSLHT